MSSGSYFSTPVLVVEIPKKMAELGGLEFQWQFFEARGNKKKAVYDKF